MLHRAACVWQLRPCCFIGQWDAAVTKPFDILLQLVLFLRGEHPQSDGESVLWLMRALQASEAYQMASPNSEFAWIVLPADQLLDSTWSARS